MDPIITFKNISKNFLFKKVLDEVSLSFEPGNFYVVLGENGAGKSTVLRIIMGLERYHGEGKIYGENFIAGDPNIKKKVGFVAETVELLTPLSMEKFFRWYSGYFSNWDHELFNKIIKEKKFDLSKKFSKYSRGQKMQMVLAAELAKKPDVLLIDEITSVLDLYSRRYFLDLLQNFVAGGGTVLLTTNVINEIQHYANHLIILKDAKIRLNSPLDQVPSKFIKLKRPNDVSISLFHNPECYWVKKNSDQTDTYIMPIQAAENEEIPEKYIDNSPISIEEIFAYYFNSEKAESSNIPLEEKEEHGKAA